MLCGLPASGKTTLARVLATDASVVLLDEPASGIDTTIVTGGSDERPDTFVLTGDIDKGERV